MKFRFRVTRVEIVEASVQATSEEDAERKVREELRVSWAYAGHWDTVHLQVDILDATPKPAPAVPANAPAVDEDELMRGLALTMKDAGKLVGVDYRTIRAGIENGTIPTVMVGNRRMIPRGRLLRAFGVDGGAD